MVEQSVHGGRRHEIVHKERVPLLERAVGRDDHRPALVTLADDLVEVDGLVVFQGPQSQVVDDEQVRRCEAE